MILVTGGNGMLGRAVVEQLLEQGEAVRSFDLIPHDKALVDSVVGDIRNLDDVRRACSDVDGVIHTASLVDLHLGKPQRLYDINIGGVENLINACRESQIKKLVYMSSAEVISGAAPLRNVDETAPYPRPHLTYYGSTKESAERLILEANDEQLATCAFRSFGIFGEGDRNFISHAVQKIRGKQIPQIGSNPGITDVVYAGNMAHALIVGLSLLAIKNRVAGQIFHVTDYTPASVQDFLLELLAPFGYHRANITIPLPVMMLVARLYELAFRLTQAERFANPIITRHQLLLSTQDYYLNSRKLQDMLRYEPLFQRKEAIQRTHNWLSQQQQGWVGEIDTRPVAEST